VADLLPDLAPCGGVGLERDCPFQQRNCIAHLVASCREAGRTPEPGDRARPQPDEFFRFTRPGEILVLRSDRLGVVVREFGRMVVSSLARFLEPGGICGMEPRASRGHQASIRDVTCQRMRESEVAVAAPDEAAPAENVEPGFATDQCAKRIGAERPPDHGPGLERSLLRRREQVDAR